MQSTTTLPKLTEAGVKALRILAGEEGNAAPAAVAKLKRDGYADESGALTQAGRKAYVSLEGNARRACYLSDCRHPVSGTTALNLLMRWPASDTNTRQVPSCTLHHERAMLVNQPAATGACVHCGQSGTSGRDDQTAPFPHECVTAEDLARLRATAQAVSDWRNGPRVIEFDSTESAYDASQCDDTITDGTVFIIREERVVGIMMGAWPVAVTPEIGDFHALNSSDKDAHAAGWDHAVMLAEAMGFMAEPTPVAPIVPAGMEAFVAHNIDLLPEYAGGLKTRTPRKTKKASKRKATRATRRRNRGAK